MSAMPTQFGGDHLLPALLRDGCAPVPVCSSEEGPAAGGGAVCPKAADDCCWECIHPKSARIVSRVVLHSSRLSELIVLDSSFDRYCLRSARSLLIGSSSAMARISCATVCSYASSLLPMIPLSVSSRSISKLLRVPS